MFGMYQQVNFYINILFSDVEKATFMNTKPIFFFPLWGVDFEPKEKITISCKACMKFTVNIDRINI